MSRPEEKSISATDIRSCISEIINRVAYGKERIHITRRGRRLAVIVSREDAELLEVMDCE